MLTLNPVQPLRYLGRCDANCPRSQRNRTRGSLRDRHLLRWRIQQRLPLAILPILRRQILLREPQAKLHRHPIQQFANRAWVPRRIRQRRKLCGRGRRQSQLGLRHLCLIAYFRQRHHAHQRAACQRWKGSSRLHQSHPLLEPIDPQRHHVWGKPRLWDCWLYCRLWLGPGDGAGDSQLWKDVECFYELALKPIWAAMDGKEIGMRGRMCLISMKSLV